MNAGVRDRAALVGPVTAARHVTEMRAVADAVYVDRALVGACARSPSARARCPRSRLGLSARACLALIRAAKAWAAAARPGPRRARGHRDPGPADPRSPVAAHGRGHLRRCASTRCDPGLLDSVPAPEDRG